VSYFLTSQKLEIDKETTVSGEEAVHIFAARRIKPGETIEIQDANNKRFLTKVVAASRKEVKVSPMQQIDTPLEPDLQIYVLLALVKEKALDYIIQKITELGVRELIIFPSTNSPIEPGNKEKRVERWQRISIEATKQSGRAYPTQVTFLDNMDQALEAARKTDLTFLLEKTGNKNFRDVSTEKPKIKSVAVIIGPEGGLTADEIKQSLAIKNSVAVRMGPRILRADTATIAAVSTIQALFGDLA
jgi:16S rRNA (uracil1498-N3)-methyltransferase